MGRLDQVEPVAMTGEESPTVIIVMGVTGTGKSTVAGLLAGSLGWDLAEGDDLHPSSNIAKMRAGRPLDHDDRWPWLATIAQWITEHIRCGTPGIVTCSALTRSYRDRLAQPGVVFVHLSGTEEQIAERLSARLDHFMPAALLKSQLETLEPLQPDEHGIIIDLAQKPNQEAAEIVRRLHLWCLARGDGGTTRE